MYRIGNDSWGQDMDFLLDHIGEDVEVYADSDEWNKREIRSALESCLRDRVDKSKVAQYSLLIKGWLNDSNYCVVRIDNTAADKKNKELMFLLKKGDL